MREAGRLVNQKAKLAEDIGQLPRLKRSPDPGDNYVRALAEAGKAENSGDLIIKAGSRVCPSLLHPFAA